MNREKQIEEMAVITCSLHRGYLDKTCGGNSECDFYCHHYARCEALYNAGYRKQHVGDWKKDKNRMTCSECGFEYFANGERFNYCPSCGSIMAGKGQT